MSVLFEPITIGDLELKNRIVMAPLTRSRAEGRVPNDMMVRHYEMRASAGLIISEAVAVDPMGVGYPATPGIWSDEQVEGWKKITDAVHAKGGKIVAQLWHVGRISHPTYLNGEKPVAPSAVKPAGFVNRLRPKSEFVEPRALELDEIKGVIEAYRKGCENAKKAGFDGVELHGANGYLLEQFLLDGTNKRTDEYGGSLENRARLMLEVTDAAIEVWGRGRVGMHLSPRMDKNDLSDSNREETYTYVTRELDKRGIAFIFMREFESEDSMLPKLRKEYSGALIANENFTKESAEQIIGQGDADAISFGRLFISNPDLVERLANGAELTPPDPDTFYEGGERGYNDYPLLFK